MQIKIKYRNIGIILTEVQIAGNLPTTDKRMQDNDATPTMIVFAIGDRVTIVDMINSTVQ